MLHFQIGIVSGNCFHLEKHMDLGGTEKDVKTESSVLQGTKEKKTPLIKKKKPLDQNL